MSWFDLLLPFQKAFRNCSGAVVDSPDFDERLPMVGGTLADRREAVQMDESEPIVKNVRDVDPYEADVFLDGVQRTLLVKYVKRLPLHFHMSAVVAINSNKDIITDPIHNFCFLYPEPNLLSEAFPKRLVKKTITDTRTGVPMSLTILFNRSRWVAREVRRRVENQLLRSLLHETPARVSHQSKILLDGIIPRRRYGLSSFSIVGVIKTHFTSYLKNEEPVLDMFSRFRSSRFSIKFKKGKRTLRVSSFYLRLRHREGDPFFGLIRLEHHKSLDSDRVAQTVLQYSLPVADTLVWDRKLYPFYECELALQGYLPSLDAIKGLFNIE